PLAGWLAVHAAVVLFIYQVRYGDEYGEWWIERMQVDVAAIHLLPVSSAGDRDADVSVGGGLAGLVERGLDAVVDEVEGGPTRPLPGVTLLVRHDEDRRVERRLLRPRRLAEVEHALAHHARAGALERLPRDVVVAPFLAALAQ